MGGELCGARACNVFKTVVEERDLLGFGAHQIANVEKRLGTRFSAADFVGQKELVKLTQDVRIPLHKALCVHSVGVAERAQRKVPF